MRVKLVSDLHYEYRGGNRFEITKTAKDSDTILVLPGDINYIDVVHEDLNRFAEQFKAVIFVPGNHEYYGTYLGKQIDKQLLKDNVYVLDNDYVYLGGDLYIGSTLWSNLSEYKGTDSINDYNQITNTNTGFRISFDDTHQLFLRNYGFLQYALAKAFKLSSIKKTIVITHHMPSNSCINKKYKNDPLNPFFASDADSLMHINYIDYWLCGHTHDSVDVSVDVTKVLGNPYGYGGENSNFNPDLIIT